MSHTKEERIIIGKEIATGKISSKEAADKYHISLSLAQLYAQQYRESHNIPSPRPQKNALKRGQSEESVKDIEMYMTMSKEELVNELIRAKINEARAKKGYEVKGVGANKEFSSLNGKNSKS